MGPLQSATSDAGHVPKKQRKVMTLTFEEKVELLDMYCRLRSAAGFSHDCMIDESSVKDECEKIKKKKFMKPSLQLHQ